MFTYFTDRDGKFQLCALAESSFDPLAAPPRFMLTEEAHHMFVGESGISRVWPRTCEVMKSTTWSIQIRCAHRERSTCRRSQRYLNFHYSVTLDLFGADQSSMRRISTAPVSRALRGS